MNIIFSIILFCIGVFVGFLILWTIGKSVDGQLIITEDEHGTKKFILDLDLDPYYIDKQKIIKFEVVHDEPPPKPPMPKPPTSQ
jgi:hypothetical protein